MSPGGGARASNRNSGSSCGSGPNSGDASLYGSDPNFAPLLGSRASASAFAVREQWIVSSATPVSAKHCGALQHTATHRNALQRTATHCSTPLQFVSSGLLVVPPL